MLRVRETSKVILVKLVSFSKDVSDEILNRGIRSAWEKSKLFWMKI